MATERPVDAPYPSEMDEIHGQSVVSMLRPSPGTNAVFVNRASEIVANLLVRNDPTKFVKAIRRTGSFDTDYRDVLVKDWYRPLAPNIKMANPATLPTGSPTAVAWSPDGRYVATGHATTPFLSVFKRVGDTFTKLTNPTTIPTVEVVSLAWSPDGKYLFVGSGPSTFVLYERNADVLSVKTLAATLLNVVPTSAPIKARWSRDGTYLAFVLANTPYHAIYKRNSASATAFTKLPDLTGLPASNHYDLSWSNDCLYLAVGSSGTPYLVVYKRSGDTFTKLAGPASLPNGACRGVSFSLDDKYLACATQSSPYVNVFLRDGDGFTKLTNPVAMGAIGTAVDWSPDGRYLTATQTGGAAPFNTTYKFNGTTFVKIADPATAIPASAANDVRFSPDGIHLAVTHNATPFITIYKSAMGPVAGPAIRVDPNGVVVVTNVSGGVSP